MLYTPVDASKDHLACSTRQSCCEQIVKYEEIVKTESSPAGILPGRACIIDPTFQHTVKVTALTVLVDRVAYARVPSLAQFAQYTIPNPTRTLHTIFP